MSDTGLHYVIEREPPDSPFRYRVFFLDDRNNEYLSDFTFTLPGARRKAKRLAKKWRKHRNLSKYVDEGLI